MSKDGDEVRVCIAGNQWACSTLGKLKNKEVKKFQGSAFHRH